MKRLLIIGCGFAFLVAATWILRAPIGVAILKNSGDADYAWELLASDPTSHSAQAHSRAFLQDRYATWQRGGHAGLRYGVAAPFRILCAGHDTRAGDDTRDAELVGLLVGIHLARGDGVRGGEFDNSPYQFGRLIQDFAANPRVTQAIQDFLVGAAAERSDVVKGGLLPIITEVARRGVHDDPRVTAAIAMHALRQGVGSSQRAGFRAAMGKLATPRVRAEGYRAALVGGVAQAGLLGGDRQWILGLALAELAATPPASDEQLAKALMVACARHSGERRAKFGMVSSIGEACLDLALAVDGLAGDMSRVAAAGGDPEQRGFAALLASEVARIQRRTPADIVTFWAGQEPTWPGLPRSKAERAKGFTFPRFGISRALQRDLEILSSVDGAIDKVLTRAIGSRSRAAVWLGVRTLAARDPKALAAAVLRRIDGFGKLARQFTYAARYDHAGFFRAGVRIEEGLLALADVQGDVELLYPWLRALSIEEAGFAQRAIKLLRSRLSAEEFADAMFDYLAIRPSFKVQEVEVYEQALAGYAQIGTEVERKLRQLLKHERKPERVGWILKYLGLRVLARTGSQSALTLIDRYAADSRAYYWTTRSTNKPGAVQRKRFLFRDLARRAAAKIRARSRLSKATVVRGRR